jgi:hypothetical protein
MTRNLIALTLLASATTSSAADIRWLTPDFFVRAGSRPAGSLRGEDPRDCKAHIADVVCLVDPAAEGQDFTARPCLPGGGAYAKPFEQIYDHLSPTFQRMFCSLNHIFIERELASTGYGGLDKPAGGLIGVRQSILDMGDELDFAAWASWKEQLMFGGVSASYTPSSTLPGYDIAQVPGLNNFLYQFVVHEFGHLFDFANHVNQQEDGCPKPTQANPKPECKFAAGAWGNLSWLTNLKPLPEQDFPGRDKLCFYRCQGNFIPLADAGALYARLFASGFINAYAATNPWDDFADGLAYFATSRYLQRDIVFDTRQGVRLDLTAKLSSPQYAAKLRYVEQFLGNPAILYP